MHSAEVKGRMLKCTIHLKICFPSGGVRQPFDFNLTACGNSSMDDNASVFLWWANVKISRIEDFSAARGANVLKGDWYLTNYTVDGLIQR